MLKPANESPRSRGLKELERTNQCARYLGDSRLFLGNRQAGEDLEVGLAGQEGLPLVL